MSIIRNCPACGKPNRIPAKHLADTGRCGACKVSLPPMSEPIAAGPPEFDEIVGALLCNFGFILLTAFRDPEHETVKLLLFRGAQVIQPVR